MGLTLLKRLDSQTAAKKYQMQNTQTEVETGSGYFTIEAYPRGNNKGEFIIYSLSGIEAFKGLSEMHLWRHCWMQKGIPILKGYTPAQQNAFSERCIQNKNFVKTYSKNGWIIINTWNKTGVLKMISYAMKKKRGMVQ